MAVYERSVEVYPDDIKQMLEKYSKYPDADSIRIASYDLRYILTEKNRKDFEQQLVLMKKLSNKLTHEAQVTERAISSAVKDETLLCVELAQKIPGIRNDPLYAKLSASQAVIIKTYLEEQKRRELAAIYDPQAEELKALLASYSAEQLAQMLQVPVNMTAKLKNRLPKPKASKDPQKPAQVVENLTATMDPPRPAELLIRGHQLKDIPRVLQDIFDKIEKHIKRSGIFLKLLGSVDDFIEALALRLDVLKKEREEIKIRAMESVTDVSGVVKQTDLKLVVGNLPSNVDGAKVAELFERVGEVQMVQLFDNYLSNVGVVTMSSVKEVEDAVRQFHGHSCLEFFGFTELADARDLLVIGGGSMPKRIYVSNLPRYVDDKALAAFFSQQGEVLEASVLHYRTNGRSRCYGFVSYNSTEDMVKALSLNGTDFHGQVIRVSVAEDRPTPGRRSY